MVVSIFVMTNEAMLHKQHFFLLKVSHLFVLEESLRERITMSNIVVLEGC